PLSAGAARWLEEVNGLTAELRPASSRPPPGPRAAPPAESKRLIPGLDFRPETLATWPRWLWPQASWWRANLPAASGPALLARRLAHAAGVLLQSGRALLCWPLALLASAFLRSRRRSARARALAPEHVLEVAAL